MIAVFNVDISREDKIHQYLRLINGMISLTDRELEILAGFITTMLEIGETDNLFSTEIRKIVSNKYGIQNVNTYVKKFVDKDLVIRKGDNYYPVKLLIPQDGGITFKFVWT